MFMLLLLLVASSLLLACLALAIFSIVKLCVELHVEPTAKSLGIIASVLAASSLIAAVQYQAIRQIVPQISVW